MDEEQFKQALTRQGLDPQVFPFYYDATAPFLDSNGAPSGAAGAVASLRRELNNFPHLFFGVRIESVYGLPDEPTADDLDRFRTAKEWLDDEAEFRIDLAQQNVTAEAITVKGMCGRNGTNWHPFSTPYPMAGGNNIQMTVRRLVGYPTIGDAAVQPVCRVTLVTASFRADMRTVPIHRRGP